MRFNHIIARKESHHSQSLSCRVRNTHGLAAFVLCFKKGLDLNKIQHLLSVLKSFKKTFALRQKNDHISSLTVHWRPLQHVHRAALNEKHFYTRKHDRQTHHVQVVLRKKRAVNSQPPNTGQRAIQQRNILFVSSYRRRWKDAWK